MNDDDLTIVYMAGSASRNDKIQAWKQRAEAAEAKLAELDAKSYTVTNGNRVHLSLSEA